MQSKIRFLAGDKVMSGTGPRRKEVISKRLHWITVLRHTCPKCGHSEGYDLGEYSNKPEVFDVGDDETARGINLQVEEAVKPRG